MSALRSYYHKKAQDTSVQMSTDSQKLSTILSNAVCEGLFQRISCNVTEITLALKQFDSQEANIIF